MVEITQITHFTHFSRKKTLRFFFIFFLLSTKNREKVCDLRDCVTKWKKHGLKALQHGFLHTILSHTFHTLFKCVISFYVIAVCLCV